MAVHVPPHSNRIRASRPERRTAAASSEGAFAPTSRVLDWAVVVSSAWLVGGFWLDAWAHIFLPQLETFFTPWHGVLYSGFLATALVLIVATWRGLAAGRPLTRALPVGYGLSAIGALVFALAGLGDMLWHTAFGIEKSVDALLSPPHLALVAGASLIVSGPLRATWFRPQPPTTERWSQLAPALISLALVLSFWSGFTEFGDPFAAHLPGTGPIVDWAAAAGVSDLRAATPPAVAELLGMAGIVIRAAFLMGGVLFLIQRWTLPFGAMALIFTIAIGPFAAAHGEFRFIPVAIVAGLIGDGLNAWLRPTREPRAALRLFAFAVPVVLFALYFLTVAITEGLSWTPSLWMGAVLEAGVIGLILSYLATPPDAEAASHQ